MKAKGRGTAIVILILLVLVGLPAGYVLSAGPVLGLVVHDFLPGRVGIIYHPLWHVCEWWEPLGRVVTWYVGVFVD